MGTLVKLYAPPVPEVAVATVLPPEVKVSVAPVTPVTVPETEYVGISVAVNAGTVALAALMVTEALVGEKMYPASEGVTV